MSSEGEEFREVLRNESDEKLVLEPGETVGVGMLSDPRPAPIPNVVILHRHGPAEDPDAVPDSGGDGA